MATRVNRVGVSSLAPRGKCVVEPAKDSPGMWYWALVIDGVFHSDGTVLTEATANSRAVEAWDEWLEDN